MLYAHRVQLKSINNSELIQLNSRKSWYFSFKYASVTNRNLSLLRIPSLPTRDDCKLASEATCMGVPTPPPLPPGSLFTRRHARAPIFPRAPCWLPDGSRWPFVGLQVFRLPPWCRFGTSPAAVRSHMEVRSCWTPVCRPTLSPLSGCRRFWHTSCCHHSILCYSRRNAIIRHLAAISIATT